MIQIYFPEWKKTVEQWNRGFIFGLIEATFHPNALEAISPDLLEYSSQFLSKLVQSCDFMFYEKQQILATFSWTYSNINVTSSLILYVARNQILRKNAELKPETSSDFTKLYQTAASQSCLYLCRLLRLWSLYLMSHSFLYIQMRMWWCLRTCYTSCPE